MTWTSPFTAVTGAVITAAGWNTSGRDNLLHLRALLADPAAANYWLQSSSASGAAFVDRAVAVLQALGYTPVHPTGDTMTGTLTVQKTQGAVSGAFATAQLVAESLDASLNPAETAGYGFHRLNNSGIYVYHAGLAAAADILRIITSSNLLATVWHSLNQGAGSGLDADLVDGQHGSYYLARANHTGTQSPSTISPQGSGSGLDADTVDGLNPTATPAAGAIPKADGSGKLDGWVTASGGVPTGLGGWVRQASEIPTGYSRETNLDGRIPVGAGTTFSTTFVELTNYGAAWSFTPTDSGHVHSGAGLGVSGSTGAPSASNGLGNNGGVSAPTTTHTHDQGSLDVTGSTDSAAAAVTSTTWTIPSRGVVWVRKN